MPLRNPDLSYRERLIAMIALQLERELNETIDHLKNAIDREDYGPVEWEAWNKRAIELVKQARAAAMPNKTIKSN